MSPEEQLRALRADDRWEPVRLGTDRASSARRSSAVRVGSLVPAVVTLLVAVLVVALSIGAIRLATPTRPQPASSSTPRVEGATAVIRGTARTTTRLIAGVGTPGGPTEAQAHELRALAERTGSLTSLPDPRRGYQVRLDAAVRSVRAAFGSAVHELGGYDGKGFFLVLNRTPTAEELQLLRLLPMPVRVHWGPQLSVQERDRQRNAAFAVLEGSYSVVGGIDAETGTQSWEYWPNRDRPRSARQVAAGIAAAVTRLTGSAPTFTISVTDLSRTPAGQAALHATGRSTSDDGVRLLIADRPTQTGSAVGIIGGPLGVNADRCVAIGDEVVIAPPGSSISADGRTVHAAGVRSFPVTSDSTAGGDGSRFDSGGTPIDAKTASTYLPHGADLCGAKRFLLIG